MGSAQGLPISGHTRAPYNAFTAVLDPVLYPLRLGLKLTGTVYGVLVGVSAQSSYGHMPLYDRAYIHRFESKIIKFDPFRDNDPYSAHSGPVIILLTR